MIMYSIKMLYYYNFNKKNKITNKYYVLNKYILVILKCFGSKIYEKNCYIMIIFPKDLYNNVN